MRITLAALITAALATVLAGIIGVAAAEAPTTTPLRSVSVEGVANVPIAQHSTLAQADAAYRQAMGAALTDGKSKAEFLATSAGATLGAVQSIVEGGGNIQCTSGEHSYVEYEGEQPDFGYGAPSTVVGVNRVAPPAGAVTPQRTPTVKRSKKRKHKGAKTATAEGCQVYAQVGLSYALS